jgi:diguanylate cyclase (GGDEF)-like protein
MRDDRQDTVDRTWALQGPGACGDPASGGGSGGHAIVILISHPDDEALGSRTRLEIGSQVTVGRDPSCEIAHPEVLSLSRCHARIEFSEVGVSVTDLDSTNGTFVNDLRVLAPTMLASGDRIQFGALHFKFYRQEDVEAAYHEAIHQLVMQDGLTEIGNRRRFDEELGREFVRAKRHDRPLSLVVFDIDRFKTINDTLGHLCGDFVLKRLTRLCLERLRSEQIFARIGGDEFAILCPETDLHGAEVLAERLRSAVAGHRFSADMVEESFAVTCSFGCAELVESMTVETDLVDAADQALYAAKESGRNRVGSA